MAVTTQSDEVLGTNFGIFASLGSSLGSWFRVASGLPNVNVFDMAYDATDDVLVAGTLGRSAWKLSNASVFISGADCQRRGAADLAGAIAGGIRIRVRAKGPAVQLPDPPRVAAGREAVDLRGV